jgi:hypothetical protein
MQAPSGHRATREYEPRELVLADALSGKPGRNGGWAETPAIAKARHGGSGVKRCRTGGPSHVDAPAIAESWSVKHHFGA